MYVNRNIPFEIIWRFGWLNIVLFILYSFVVFSMHNYLLINYQFQMHIPFALIGPVGVAVAIYTSFKNGQSYDRTWEARKNWGALAGLSKIFANQVMVYVNQKDDSAAKILLHRQLAILNAHKLQLRVKSLHSKKYAPWLHKYYFGTATESDWKNEVASFLEDKEYANIMSKTSKAYHILLMQNQHLAALRNNNVINEFQHMEMIKVLDGCIENMGKNERIKSTPFPRQYAFFSKSFIVIFILMLPFGFLDLYNNHYSLASYITMGFIFTIVAWLYITMEIVGSYSEDPFEHFATDIPMNVICRNVQIDYAEILDEKIIPEKVMPVDGILL
nr:hypothetical protein [Bacteroidota bacterium]